MSRGESVKEKKENKKQTWNYPKRLFYLFLFCILLLYIQYGYLSLSYEVTGITSSMNYGLKEIFSFLGEHYMLWGGRIVGFFYEIFLGHISKDIYWFFQSLCIVLIFVFIYSVFQKFVNLAEVSLRR